MGVYKMRKLFSMLFAFSLMLAVAQGALATLWYNMSFYTDMQFGNGDSHVVIQNSNDRWDFYNWIAYTNGGNNTRQFRVRYHDDGLKPTGYYPIPGGYEDGSAGTDVDDTLIYANLWYVPTYIFAGETNQMTYQGINSSNEAIWTYISGNWRLTSKVTGFDARYTITSDKFASISDWDAAKKSDVDRLWGDNDYFLDTAKEYPFFSYDLAGDGNANGLFDAGDINVNTGNIVLTSYWTYIGGYTPGYVLGPPSIPYVNIESDQIGEPIPEPGTLLLLGSGLAGLMGYGSGRFRRKKE